MDLGQKLRQARLEAGLSQRQLCGNEITRNMLSQIENGAARPSMDTLAYLAGRLGKTVSYFLEESAVTSPNLRCMEKARQCRRAGDAGGVLAALGDYRGPDPVFDQEMGLLALLSRLELAQQAAEEGRLPYARQLLQEAEEMQTLYATRELEQRRLWLAFLADPTRTDGALALELDHLLMAKAAAEPDRRLALLAACQDQTAPRWNLAMGKALVERGDYAGAAVCLHRAEKAFPEAVWPALERCYREMKDFEKAYEYLAKQRQQ